MNGRALSETNAAGEIQRENEYGYCLDELSSKRRDAAARKNV